MSGKIANFHRKLSARLGPISVWKTFWLMVDFGYERIVHGVMLEDYLKYEFYYRSFRGRRTFACGRKKTSFYARFNPPEARRVFDDKALFAERFSDFTGREVLDMKTASFDTFQDFARRHPIGFAKVTDGHFGNGATRVELDTPERIRAAYDSMAGGNIVLEVYIQQCDEMRAFNESSVNSIRVMTFAHPDGTASVLPYAAVRFGRAGRVADNFHYDGIAAMVDTESGRVMTKGIDQHGRRFAIHPDSGLAIVGFRIPQWEKICETCAKAALVCPEVHCVGWDVTVTNTGEAVLIEGNGRPDPDIIQTGDGIGKWYLYEAFAAEFDA